MLTCRRLNLSLSIAVVLLSMGMNDGTTLARTWIEMGRETTIRVGEEMSLRSRHQDRADARAHRITRAAVAAGLAGLWYDKRRCRS